MFLCPLLGNISWGTGWVFPWCLPTQQQNSCLPRATCVTCSGMQAGRKGWWIGTKQQGCGSHTHRETLHPATQRKDMRRNEVGYKWTNSEPAWSLVVVSEEMLWNLCLCAISFLANPAPAVTPESWFPRSFSSCCNQLWCLLRSARREHAHLPEQGIIQRHTNYSLQR